MSEQETFEILSLRQESSTYNSIHWTNCDGQLHRKFGPAIEYANGDRAWYLEDKRHREDGPAIECVNGTKLWYKHGRLHRLDGPAIAMCNGQIQWYIEGVKLTREEFRERTRHA